MSFSFMVQYLHDIPCSKKNASKDEAVMPLTTSLATHNWVVTPAEAAHATPFPNRYKIQDPNFSIFSPRQHPKLFIAHHHRGPAGASYQANEVLIIPPVIVHTDRQILFPQQARGAPPPRINPFQITMTGN